MMESPIIFLFILLSSIAIFTKYKSPTDAYRIFKLLPMGMLIIWVAQGNEVQNGSYAQAILVGLCFSILGDFLLLFPSHFKSGLFAFLIGHIWYIIGFSSENWSLPIWPTVLIIMLGIGLVSQLYPSAGRIKIPVVLYIVIIGAMGVAAFGRWDAMPLTSSFYGAMGASLFMISDGVLGWNKFKISFPSAEAIILSTYYLGQWMIAFSTL